MCCIGGDLTERSAFCGVMDLPPPVKKKKKSSHNKIHDTLEKVARSIQGKKKKKYAGCC